jgi:hypothetical protein
VASASFVKTDIVVGRERVGSEVDVVRARCSKERVGRAFARFYAHTRRLACCAYGETWPGQAVDAFNDSNPS